jgi:hypothetical protein
MKKILIVLTVLCSCNNNNGNKIKPEHIENLAKEFMQTNVIPEMKGPKPYEVTGAQVVEKTVADMINDYRFTYQHLSLSKEDSLLNKERLDSLIRISTHPDSIISVTVNVSYKTKYKRGDIVTDSIKLGYDPQKDKVTFWPF